MAKKSLALDLDAELVDRLGRYSEERGAEIADVVGELIARLPLNGACANGGAPQNNGSATDTAASDHGWRSELTPAVRNLLGGAANDDRDAARDDPRDEEWLRNLPPITRRLLGAASPGVSEEDYKEYLWQKYGR